MLERRAIDVVTLTNSSTVCNLVEEIGGRLDLLGGLIVASIGPVTSRTARDLGLQVDVEADVHTIPGLTDALVSWHSK